MPNKEIDRPYGPGFLLVPDDSGEVFMEDCRIIFRNFAGAESQFNREGDRNFCVVIPDPDIADDMAKDGWNIKQAKPRDEETPGDFYLQVSVAFKYRPPVLFLVNSNGRVRVGVDQVEIFDQIDIQKVDLLVTPYRWTVGENTGIKAYVKSMAITIREDYLQQKYADVPELGADGQKFEVEEGSQEATPDEDGVYTGELVD